MLVQPGTTGWGSTLTLRLQDAPASGTVYVAIFDSADNFGDLRNPVFEAPYDLAEGEELSTGEIPPGEYAVAIFFDENENGFLDENFIGIPREPVGFSNGYRPRGPPAYAKAAFTLPEDGRVAFDVTLEKPLGDLGQIGLGIGVIGQSSVYVDSDESALQPIPAITYLGNRVQIFGPRAQVGLLGSGDLRLAALARYRLPAYEEDDSDALAGLGDRKDTLMSGLALQAELPAGIDISLEYEIDVLDEIGGGQGSAGIDRSFSWGVASLTPAFTLNWLDADLANHDFGVEDEGAIPGRPAYDVGEALTYELGLSALVEVARDWRLVLSGSLEFLDTAITRSPIVDEDYRLNGFIALNYLL